MPSLFKKQAPEPAPEAPDADGKVSGKGRPTPTRKEAQAARRSPSARAAARSGAKPGDPKAARQAMREVRREKASEYRRAMNSGDVSKLPPRERVPERVMARDLVDQRRNLGPPLLAVIVVAYFLGLAPSVAVKAIGFWLLPLCLLGIIADSVFVARSISRKVREKYPNSTVKLKAYVGQRALMPARWRQPRPRPGIVVGRWIPRGK